MACGLPVIACNAHGPAEIVRDGKSGWLIPADDERALAAALVEAGTDANERHRRGQQAAAKAHHDYGWPAVTTRITNIYREITLSKQQPPVAPASGRVT